MQLGKEGSLLAAGRGSTSGGPRLVNIRKGEEGWSVVLYEAMSKLQGGSRSSAHKFPRYVSYPSRQSLGSRAMVQSGVCFA